jgi:hypothetical protein
MPSPIYQLTAQDLLQVRPPAELGARFFAPADNSRVAVLSCVRTGYRDACTVFPAGSGQAPLRSPPPRRAAQC